MQKLLKYSTINFSLQPDSYLKVQIKYTALKRHRLFFFFKFIEGGSFDGYELIKFFCSKILASILDISLKGLSWNELILTEMVIDENNNFSEHKKQKFYLYDYFHGTSSQNGSSFTENKMIIKITFTSNRESNLTLYGVDEAILETDNPKLTEVLGLFDQNNTWTLQDCQIQLKGLSLRLGEPLAADIAR